MDNIEKMTEVTKKGVYEYLCDNFDITNFNGAESFSLNAPDDWISYAEVFLYTNGYLDEKGFEAIVNHQVNFRKIINDCFNKWRNQLSIFDIAEYLGKEHIETTTGRNGYPQNIKDAIIGFDTFEEAKAAANKFGLDIQTFHRKAGWQLWERNGYTAYEEFTNSCEDYGDDFREFSKNDIIDFINDEVMEAIDEFTSIESVQELLDAKNDLLNKIVEAKDDEIVITHCGEYYDTIKKKSMSFSYDGKTDVIGLIRTDY
jgi:hypothetical protein